MKDIVITGGGSGLADAILESLESIDADYRLRLVDSMEHAGEARRWRGRTVVIQSDSEVDFSGATLVLDLNHSYVGDAQVFRPGLSSASLLRRMLSFLEPNAIGALYGVVREPVAEITGGVEALASQVTQLFNGRDPEPQPFGGTLAFNCRTLDDSGLIESLQMIPALNGAAISIERYQSDAFYTIHASLWMKLSTKIDFDAVLSIGNTNYEQGLSIAPNTGRVDGDAEMKVYVRKVSEEWVNLMVSADLEKTIWAQEAKSIVLNELGISE